MTSITLDELLLDLALAFPKLNAQPLPEARGENFHGPKAWFDRQVLMPDEYPIFIRPDQLEGREPPGYTRRVHDGFIAWLARRGWHVFAWPADRLPDAHLLVPTESLLAEAQRIAPPAESHESDAHAHQVDVARICSVATKLAQAGLAMDKLSPAQRSQALELSKIPRPSPSADSPPPAAGSAPDTPSDAVTGDEKHGA